LVFVHDGVLYSTKKENFVVNEVKDVQFTMMDLKELKSDIKPSRILLFAAQRKDFQIVDTTKEARKDVIQIVLEETTLMYDLTEHKEIGIINNYRSLFSSKNFMQTGFKIVSPLLTPISMNEAQNFMLKPKDNDKPCAAFLQYSELDLIEMSRLR